MNRFITVFGQVRSCWGVQVMAAIDIQPWLFRVEPFRQDWDNGLTLPARYPLSLQVKADDVESSHLLDIKGKPNYLLGVERR